MMTSDHDGQSEEAFLGWLEHQIGFENFGVVFERGLSRPRKAFANLIQDLKNTPVITIAGTNGKGETALFIERLLNEQGKKTALWTSPHIISITERFRFSGENCELDELIRRSKKAFEVLNQKNIHLSFYEFLFFVFLTWVRDQINSLDYLILEVGLGGRLDAVNMLDASVVALTTIGRDHQKYLGYRYDLILWEKLGPVRPGCWFYTGNDSDYVLSKVKHSLSGNPVRQTVCDTRSKTTWHDKNRLMALAIVDDLVPGSDHQVDMTGESRPVFGRGDSLTIDNCQFTFIGAHNVQGVREFIRSYYYSDTQTISVLCSFSDREQKDLLGIAAMLRAVARPDFKIRICQFDHPRALPLAKLRGIFENRTGQKENSCGERVAIESSAQSDEGQYFVVVEDWNQWMDKFIGSAKQQEKNCQAVVLGSYFFIGQVRKYLSTTSFS